MIREEIEDMTGSEDANAILRRVENELANIQSNLQLLYEKDDMDGFATEAVRLKYYSRVFQKTKFYIISTTVRS